MRIKYNVMALLIAAMLPSGISAQSLSKAEATYAQFNKLRASNDKASMYNALYHSYEEYAKVLNASTINSSNYSVSKLALKDIFQYLPSGAAWSQSKGQQTNCIMFAQAYIDITLMEAFKGDILPKSENHAALAHIAAAGAYNTGNYDKAVLYLRAYLESGDQRKREECYRSLVEAYIKLNKQKEAVAAITEAIKYYPNNKNLLDLGISNAMVTEEWDNLQFFLDKALALNPNDLSYLDAQGKLYEKRNDFQKAITVYNKLNKLKPQNLDINKHLALDYYNMGVDYFNKALMEQGSSAEKKYKRQANEYFSAAAPILENVIANDPKAAGHTQALGIVYNCIGEKDKRDEVNDKLMAFNMQPVSDNTIPQVIGFDLNSPPKPEPQPEPMPTDYAQYQKKYVEDNYVRWYRQTQFETDEEYKERVNDENCKRKVNELNEEAEKKYIAQHVKKITHKDLSLGQYDPNNQTYMITSDYGNMVIKVPRAKKESEIFYSTWVGMQFKEPVFYIDNNYKIRLSSLTFVTPAGKSYQYNRSQKEIAYVPRVNSGDIKIPDIEQRPKPGPEPESQPRNDYASSDVDINIPVSKVVNDKTFAFVIANETYDVVSKVDYAHNDGFVFSEYCKKTLGLPKENVKYNENVTYGKLLRTIEQIKKTAKAYKGDISIILYYAGHGIPDDSTKDAYLLPVDADGVNTQGCYSLNKLYMELGELNARQIVVFLDACFSGSKRDGGMLASARGVAIKPKPVEAKGNMIVYAAADGNQTALPWKEKKHGLFTYCLLKKLQESNGNVSLRELGDYIIDNVSQKAMQYNEKEQTPTVRASISLGTDWEKQTLRPKK